MYSDDMSGLYDTCDGTLRRPDLDILNCGGADCVVSWVVGSEGAVLLDILVIITSRGVSAELDDTDEPLDSETLPTEAAKSGTVDEL